MKTELIYSYSSSSLANLSRSPSSGSILHQRDKSQSVSTTDGLDQSETSEEFSNEGCCSAWARNTFKKKLLYKKLPILTWLPKYNTECLIADIISATTIALTLLPQGLALASVGGLPPQYGLYSGFMGCFVYIFFGSTADTTIGPTAIMAIITLSYTADKPPEYAVFLAFITGIITLGMGLLQLGFIVNFISTPVMSGFTSAAALTICSTQVDSLLGLDYKANGFLDVVKGAAEHIEEIRRDDAILALCCIIVLLFLMKLQDITAMCGDFHPVVKKLIWLISTARSVIVIIACTIVFGIIDDPDKVRFVGDLVAGLPSFKPPPFTIVGNNTPTGEIEEYGANYMFKHHLSALIVLPLLALMEHITCAKAFAGTKRVDASQEMICIGLSNILGSFVSSMPITGSFSRTVINHASGVKTPLAGLITGTLVLLALQFLTPYFYYIPKASLAAVICCAVIFTVDFAIIYPMWKSKKADLIPWLATFLISLLLGLEYGVLIGFVISVVFLLYYAASPAVRVKRGTSSRGYEFILVHLDRSLTFPSVDYTRYVIMKSGRNFAHGNIPVVIECQHIQFADFTAAQGIRDLFKMYNEEGRPLILWQAKPSIVRIITSVMEISNVPFHHCTTEEELEYKLEGFVKELEDKSDVKITFTSIDDDKKEADGDDDGHEITTYEKSENNNSALHI